MENPFLILTKEQYEGHYNDRLISERFIYVDERRQIQKIIATRSNFKVLVTGHAGSGKTTLIYMLKNQIANNANEIINLGNIYSGSAQLDKILSSLSVEKILFIDGLECVSQSILNKLFDMINNMGFKRVIYTSRQISTHNQLFPKQNMEDYFTHIVELHALTNTQSIELINKIVNSMDNNDRISSSIINEIKAKQAPYTPREIIRYLYAINDKSNQQDIDTTLNSKILLPSIDLITPTKKVISDITIINDTLLKKAKDNPIIIDKLSPREFEEMVYELLDKKGFKVSLTKQTRDGGKDIIVVQQSVLGNFSIYVECKKYSKNRPINVGLVRALYGSVMADNATAGMLVTTSYFSKDAKAFTITISNRMSLMDYYDLVQAIYDLNI